MNEMKVIKFLKELLVFDDYILYDEDKQSLCIDTGWFPIDKLQERFDKLIKEV